MVLYLAVQYLPGQGMSGILKSQESRFKVSLPRIAGYSRPLSDVGVFLA